MKQVLYPILIGSRAAKTNRQDSDFDIILDDMTLLKNIPEGIKVDVFNRDYDLELMRYVNDLEDVEHVDIFGLDVIVCPLDILAVIYLTSIIRIIPYANDQLTNIQIWHKRIKTYNKIRSNINYKEFDEKLYDESTFIGNNYKKRFDDKINTYGDALISLEESAKIFFDDNVKRKFDHDYLHDIVAELNRGPEDKAPIFERYQRDDSVGLDEELFKNGESSEKINMVQEEIITLLLERKIIPSLDLEGNYLLEQYFTDLQEISAHFATNLCGQGHHFLRKWVLDHFSIIFNLSVSRDTIIERAQELCGVTDKVITMRNTFYKGMSVQSKKIFSKLCSKYGDMISDDDGNKLFLSGENRGLLETPEGQPNILLEISGSDGFICFKQINFEENKDDDSQIYIRNSDKTITDTRYIIKEIKINKVRNVVYYCSMRSCAGYCNRDHYCRKNDSENEYEFNDLSVEDYNYKYKYKDSIDEYDKHETRINYYINNYGTGKKIPLCEEISKYLLEIDMRNEEENCIIF